MTTIKIAGNLDIPNKHECDNRVYATQGIAPTVHAAFGLGGGITTKIIEIKCAPKP